MIVTQKQYLLIITFITFIACIICASGCGRMDVVHSGHIDINVEFDVTSFCKDSSNPAKCKQDVTDYILGEGK